MLGAWLGLLPGCAPVAEQRPPRDPTTAPAPAAAPERLAPIRDAVRAAQQALAADQLDAALLSLRRAEQLLGMGGADVAPAPDGAASDGSAGPQAALAEIEGALKPALRQRLLAKYGDRYGLRSPQQLDMVLERGLPTAQLFLQPERRCWRFDHEPGATLSCFTREGDMDLELLSTPAVLAEVERLNQAGDRLGREQAGVLLARGQPVARTESPARVCWVYGPPRDTTPAGSYELYCWTRGGDPRLSHYEDVHVSVAFEPALLDQAAARYGARTPQRLRTLLSLGLPEAQRTLEGGQLCWLYRERAPGPGDEVLSLHCWSNSGQLAHYRPVHPAILPDLSRLGSKYDARTPAQLDLILEQGPPLSVTRGETRCWTYPRERYCFDAAGGLVEHTARQPSAPPPARPAP